MAPDHDLDLPQPGTAQSTRDDDQTEERLPLFAYLQAPEHRPYLAMMRLFTSTLLADLGSHWPRCAKDLTEEIAMGGFLSQAFYNLHIAAAAETLRMQANEAMAAAFDKVDFIVAATNPGPAFPAENPTSNPEQDITDLFRGSSVARWGIRGVLGTTRVVSAFAPKLPNLILDEASRRLPDMVSMGALTIISNVYGNPAVSIPAGTIGGLPVGMQVLGRHHEDGLLLDVALAVERGRPWPLVAPTVAASDEAMVAAQPHDHPG